MRVAPPPAAQLSPQDRDRKSTRLNSSHANISYAVFCLKNKLSNASLQSILRLTILLIAHLFGYQRVAKNVILFVIYITDGPVLSGTASHATALRDVDVA